MSTKKHCGSDIALRCLTPLLLLTASAHATIVTGHIEFPHGVKAAPMTVEIVRVADGKDFTLTAHNGSFKVDLKPGQYGAIAKGQHLQTGGRTFNVGPGLHGPRLRAYVTPAPQASLGDELEKLHESAKALRLDDKAEPDRLREVDQPNTARLTEIIETHGWPRESSVGFRGVQAAFFIAQHSGGGFLKRCLPMMRAAAEANELALDLLAMAEDRARMEDGQTQLYGTQLQSDASGKQHLWPVEDPDHIDQRRARVGLGKHAEYLAKFGIH